MCYAAPGPRCSTHAHATLLRAEQAYADAQSAYDAACATNPDAAAIMNQGTYHPGLFPLWSDRKQAKSAVADARSAYDATPAGIRELKAQAAALQERLGSAAGDDSQHQRIITRITGGQQRRATALTAYKAVHGTPAASTADDAAEEQAAQEPVALCTCIAYRYKQTCEHLDAAADTARRKYLPTGHEAALELHAANRSLLAASDRFAAALAQSRDDETDPDTDPAVQEARRRMSRYSSAASKAANRFHTTAEGQAYLHRKADRLEQAMGYSSGLSANYRQWAAAGADTRAADEAAFIKATGQEPPAVTMSGPPAVDYGHGGCDCDDFGWTGACPHTDPEQAQQAALTNAVSGAVRTAGFGTAVDRIGRQREPLGSRLRRLISRR